MTFVSSNNLVVFFFGQRKKQAKKHEKHTFSTPQPQKKWRYRAVAVLSFYDTVKLIKAQNRA